MKTLILLFALLTVPMRGQSLISDKDTVKIYGLDFYDSYKISSPNITIECVPDSARELLFTIKQLLSLYSEYERECYADSTARTYDLYKWNQDTVRFSVSIDPGYTPGYIGRRVIYDHRQPTFTGFMEFLRKRVK